MTFVLVHGGGFDRGCGEPLMPFLRPDAHAVDLPGRGTLQLDLAAARFCNDMDEAQRAFTRSLLVPESFGVISGRWTWTASGCGCRGRT